MFYIGRKPECGCVVQSVADMPLFKKHTADAVAEMIRGGLVVERVTGEVMAAEFRWEGCPHPPLGQQQMRLEV